MCANYLSICFPLWGGWITVHYQWWQSEKLHCGDFPGFLISFISAGISASQRTAHPEFTFALPLAPLLALWGRCSFPPAPPRLFFFFFYKSKRTTLLGNRPRWLWRASKTGRQSWWSFHSITCELAIFMGLMEAPLPCQCKHRPSLLFYQWPPQPLWRGGKAFFLCAHARECVCQCLLTERWLWF